jgi:hypothetical protein
MCLWKCKAYCQRTTITRYVPQETQPLPSGSTVEVDRYLTGQYVRVTELIISGQVTHVFIVFSYDVSGIIIHKINQFLVAFDIVAAESVFA